MKTNGSLRDETVKHTTINPKEIEKIEYTNIYLKKQLVKRVINKYDGKKSKQSNRRAPKVKKDSIHQIPSRNHLISKNRKINYFLCTLLLNNSVVNTLKNKLI